MIPAPIAAPGIPGKADQKRHGNARQYTMTKRIADESQSAQDNKSAGNGTGDGDQDAGNEGLKHKSIG